MSAVIVSDSPTSNVNFKRNKSQLMQGNNVMNDLNLIEIQELENFSNENKDLKFQTYVLEKLNKIEKQNSQILKHLNHCPGLNKNFEATLYQPLAGYPLSTIDEFRKLESNENIEGLKKVRDHLVRLGGSKLKEFLSSALKEVMTDELVCKFTGHKQKDTEKFGDTKISNMFYSAAVDCPLFPGPESKETFKLGMLDVFKSTKQRHRNKEKPKRREDELDHAINIVKKYLVPEDIEIPDNQIETDTDASESDGI